MGSFSINNHNHSFQVDLKLKPGQTQAAIEAAEDNGADDLFFKVNDETHVLSGTHIDTDQLKVGQTFTYKGETAEVLFVDDEINSAIEAMGHSAKAVGLTSGAVALASGSFLGVFTTAFNASTATAIKAGVRAGGIIGAGVAALGFVGPALYGAVQDADYNVLRPFSE